MAVSFIILCMCKARKFSKSPLVLLIVEYGKTK